MGHLTEQRGRGEPLLPVTPKELQYPVGMLDLGDVEVRVHPVDRFDLGLHPLGRYLRAVESQLAVTVGLTRGAGERRSFGGQLLRSRSRLACKLSAAGTRKRNTSRRSTRRASSAQLQRSVAMSRTLIGGHCRRGGDFRDRQLLHHSHSREADSDALASQSTTEQGARQADSGRSYTHVRSGIRPTASASARPSTQNGSARSCWSYCSSEG